MRAAGFKEGEIERWERGGMIAGPSAGVRGGGREGEDECAQVRWRKRGQGREWDVGKAVDAG